MRGFPGLEIHFRWVHKELQGFLFFLLASFLLLFPLDADPPLSRQVQGPAPAPHSNPSLPTDPSLLDQLLSALEQGKTSELHVVSPVSEKDFTGAEGQERRQARRAQSAMRILAGQETAKALSVLLRHPFSDTLSLHQFWERTLAHLPRPLPTRVFGEVCRVGRGARPCAPTTPSPPGDRGKNDEGGRRKDEGGSPPGNVGKMGPSCSFLCHSRGGGNPVFSTPGDMGRISEGIVILSRNLLDKDVKKSFLFSVIQSTSQCLDFSTLDGRLPTADHRRPDFSTADGRLSTVHCPLPDSSTPQLATAFQILGEVQASFTAKEKKDFQTACSAAPPALRFYCRFPDFSTSRLLDIGQPRGVAPTDSSTSQLPDSSTPRLFRERAFPENKKRFFQAGGTPSAWTALNKALVWLASVQEPDGSWKAAKYNPFHAEGAGEVQPQSGRGTTSSGFIGLPVFQGIEDRWIDPAVTGLALLAFLGRGDMSHPNPNNPYARTIQKGLAYLVSLQRPDGLIDAPASRQLTVNSQRSTVDSGHSTPQLLDSSTSQLPPAAPPGQLGFAAADRKHGGRAIIRLYNHNITLLTLVEAYAMTRDRALEKPLGKAWSYTQSPGFKNPLFSFSQSLALDDVAPSIFYIQAISEMAHLQPLDVDCRPSAVNGQLPKSPQRGDKERGTKNRRSKSRSPTVNRRLMTDDCQLPRALQQAKQYLDLLTRREDGRFYALSAVPVCLGGYDAVATALAARLFLGETPSDPLEKSLFQKGLAFIRPVLPRWNPFYQIPSHFPQRVADLFFNDEDIVNEFYWYYATLAIQAAAPGDWRPWFDRLQKILVTHQREYGRFAGSWDPEGPWARVGGRIYVTAFLALTLEAPFSYDMASLNQPPSQLYHQDTEIRRRRKK